MCKNACGFGSVTRLWIWKSGFPVLGDYASGAGLWVGFWVVCGDLAGSVRKWTPTSPYAALIAAISGAMPMIFMTRLRL